MSKIDTTAMAATATTGVMTGAHDLLMNGIVLPLIAGVLVPFIRDWASRYFEKRRLRKQAKNEQQ